ncbi:CHAT domain-containing protein [candidate division KSB1 bacterium]|nr:CHAT domain-containing protein [candidate division KSB1 bacterium]
MTMLKILFADDLIPDQAISKHDMQHRFCESAMKKNLKKQHPEWSVKFINESILMYHAINTLCCANLSVSIANKYNDAKKIFHHAHFDVAIIDLGWQSDQSIPEAQRSYAGWKLCEEIDELNKNKENKKTIIILYSSRVERDPSIYIHATVRGILPVLKTKNKTSFEALKAAVKFIERHIFSNSDQLSNGHSTPASFESYIQKINVLFLAADPNDATRLRLGEEHRQIQQKLQMAKERDLFNLQERMSVRPEDLTQALLDTSPQVVHFSGHGTYDGALCFEDPVGICQPIEPEGLAALFARFSDHVQCVILNACYSELQAKAIVKHVDYVIGMKHEIADKAAVAFSVGFYQGLGAGLPIEDAYQLGCVQVKLQGIPGELTPILLQKNNCPNITRPHRCSKKSNNINLNRLLSRHIGNGAKKYAPIYN